MVNYKEMIQIIKSSHPNFERMMNEDEENDVSKAWAVPGILQTCRKLLFECRNNHNLDTIGNQ